MPKEAVWLLEADHLVELTGKAHLAAGWSDRNREDHPGRAASPEHAPRGDGGSTGGDAVVDQDHGAACHRQGLALAAVDERATVEFGGLAANDRLELLFAHPDQLDVLRADHANTPLGDCPDPVLGLERSSELADEQDVERRIQRHGDLIADRDTASWERQHHRII